MAETPRHFFVADFDVKGDLRALAEYRYEDLERIPGAGELIASFEQQIAALLGKPAAVFMPSGTMCQQIALRIWADRRGIRCFWPIVWI